MGGKAKWAFVPLPALRGEREPERSEAGRGARHWIGHVHQPHRSAHLAEACGSSIEPVREQRGSDHIDSVPGPPPRSQKGSPPSPPSAGVGESNPVHPPKNVGPARPFSPLPFS